MERFCVLGKGISHSCSPAMHRACFGRLGLAWDYGRLDVDVEEARRAIESRDYLGMNVTMPYKPLAMELADVVCASALMAGGANVLSLKDGTLSAYNVDGIGAVDWLRMRGVSFDGARVVVCGTGPTSLAIMHAAAAAGARDVSLLGRNAAKSSSSLARYREELATAVKRGMEFPQGAYPGLSLPEVLDGVSFRSSDYAHGSGLISSADVIVDATPLGMNPGDPAPFDVSLLRSGQVVFDVVYGHGRTALAKASAEAACTFVDGEGMLVAQAVASELIWLKDQNIPASLPPREMFRLMKDAAGFQC